MDCIFCKIINREIPASIQYEDEKVIAFKDIHPVAPVHLLIIPKKHIPEFYKLQEEDNDVLIAIKNAIQMLIKENNLDTRGYKIEVNGGGAQIVDHLHFHLIGPASRPQI